MVMRCCRRCGEVEFVDDEIAEDRSVECAGEDMLLCTRCFIEFRDWFYDLSPELTLVDTAP